MTEKDPPAAKAGASSATRNAKPFETNPVRPCKQQPCTNLAAPRHCAPGQEWNGAVCIPKQPSALDCSAGQAWNGSKCEDCATTQGISANTAVEARMEKPDMETACRQNPSGQQCQTATLRHDGAVLRYRMQYDSAPVGCRGLMADPLIL